MCADLSEVRECRIQTELEMHCGRRRARAIRARNRRRHHLCSWHVRCQVGRHHCTMMALATMPSAADRQVGIRVGRCGVDERYDVQPGEEGDQQNRGKMAQASLLCDNLKAFRREDAPQPVRGEMSPISPDSHQLLPLHLATTCDGASISTPGSSTHPSGQEPLQPR